MPGEVGGSWSSSALMPQPAAHRLRLRRRRSLSRQEQIGCGECLKAPERNARMQHTDATASRVLLAKGCPQQRSHGTAPLPAAAAASRAHPPPICLRQPRGGLQGHHAGIMAPAASGCRSRRQGHDVRAWRIPCRGGPRGTVSVPRHGVGQPARGRGGAARRPGPKGRQRAQQAGQASQAAGAQRAGEGRARCQGRLLGVEVVEAAKRRFVAGGVGGGAAGAVPQADGVLPRPVPKQVAPAGVSGQGRGGSARQPQRRHLAAER